MQSHLSKTESIEREFAFNWLFFFIFSSFAYLASSDYGNTFGGVKSIPVPMWIIYDILLEMGFDVSHVICEFQIFWIYLFICGDDICFFFSSVVYLCCYAFNRGINFCQGNVHVTIFISLLLVLFEVLAFYRACDVYTWQKEHEKN